MTGFIAFRWLFNLMRTFLNCTLQENRSSCGIDPLLYAARSIAAGVKYNLPATDWLGMDSCRRDFARSRTDQRNAGLALPFKIGPFIAFTAV